MRGSMTGGMNGVAPFPCSISHCGTHAQAFLPSALHCMQLESSLGGHGGLEVLYLDDDLLISRDDELGMAIFVRAMPAP